MEFFIKQNATLPVLKFNLISDGRSDYNHVNNIVGDSSIFMTMTNLHTSSVIIYDGICQKYIDANTNDYYVNFQFNQRETSEVGRYLVEFKISNTQGELILPLTEKIYVNITDSFIQTDYCC